jgi:hypothetical protein
MLFADKDETLIVYDILYRKGETIGGWLFSLEKNCYNGIH